MPLRPEMRRYYGPDWRAYRELVIEIAHNRCLACRDHLPSCLLTLAHLHHDPRDRRMVAVLCFPCHARHDAQHRYAMIRRSRAMREGQQWLWPEVEWNPYPRWQIPAAALPRTASLFPDGL
jgi:5-methylcytosine-specific restriction endonuclease McrA